VKIEGLQCNRVIAKRQNERHRFCETLEILSQVSRTYFKGGKILPYILPNILMVMPFSLHCDYLAEKRKQKQSVGLRWLIRLKIINFDARDDAYIDCCFEVTRLLKSRCSWNEETNWRTNVLYFLNEYLFNI